MRGDDNQDGQEVPECQDGDDHNGNEVKRPPSGVNEEKKEDKVATVVLSKCMPAAEYSHLAIENKMLSD